MTDAGALAGYAAGWLDTPPALVLVEGERSSTPVSRSFPGVVVAVGPVPAGRFVPVAADVALTDAAPSDGVDLPAPWVRVADVAEAVGELERVVSDAQTAGAAMALVHVLRAGQEAPAEGGLLIESLAYSMLQSGPAFAAWRARRPERVPERCRGDEVVTEREGNLLRVVLNRPGRHNAYNRCMRELLLAALAVPGADPEVRVELSGRGPSFCSGGDLDEFGTFADPVAAHATRVGRSPARLLADLRHRVTARVHGACAGSGIELPAFADRVVARPDTRFWLPELAMGLIPGAGGTVSLTRRIGRHRTAWMGLTGAAIDAPTALSWGLIDGIDTAGSGGIDTAGWGGIDTAGWGDERR
jgi:enoyl-CoA hydratase/carnithine racemase